MRCTEWFAGRGADEPPVRAWLSPTALAWRLWALAIAMAIVLPLACSGCAEGRHLTKEQDEELARFCDRPGGCTVLPAEQWRAIKELLERLGLKPEEFI